MARTRTRVLAIGVFGAVVPASGVARGCRPPDRQSRFNRAIAGVWSLGRARREAARVRPAAQPLTECPLTGTLTSASSPRLRQPPCGWPAILEDKVNGSFADGTRGSCRVERPRTRPWPMEAQVRGWWGRVPQAPSGVGWTAVSRAATLLVCAAFCLEPCRDIHPDDFLGA